MSGLRRLIAAATITLGASAAAAGCTEDDPGEELRRSLAQARYELTDFGGHWAWVPHDHLEPVWEPPAGTKTIAGGGSTDPREVVGDEVTPDDLDLENAGRAHTDDAGDIWLLTYGTVIHIDGEDVERIFDIGDGPGAAFALAVGPDQELAVTNRTSIGVIGPGEDDFRDLRLRSDPIRTYGVAYQADGTLLSAGTYGRLVSVENNGENRALLDVSDEPDPSLATFSFVTVLSDDRIVLATWEEVGMDIQVVEDRALRPVGDATGQPLPPADITSLAPAPDGRLIVTTPDTIEAVDVDTGESDTLVDLDGAEGTASAAASGDDLVFLADGRLWRLPDAFA